jgi:hypothetical protein
MPFLLQTLLDSSRFRPCGPVRLEVPADALQPINAAQAHVELIVVHLLDRRSLDGQLTRPSGLRRLAAGARPPMVEVGRSRVQLHGPATAGWSLISPTARGRRIRRRWRGRFPPDRTPIHAVVHRRWLVEATCLGIPPERWVGQVAGRRESARVVEEAAAALARDDPSPRPQGCRAGRAPAATGAAAFPMSRARVGDGNPWDLLILLALVLARRRGRADESIARSAPLHLVPSRSGW